jgi:Ca2+-binding RTX toxin-like protein
MAAADTFILYSDEGVTELERYTALQVFEIALGISADDNLVGTPGDDFLYGGGGLDMIEGLEGNDDLEGGNDEDTILGGDGDDRLTGDAYIQTAPGQWQRVDDGAADILFGEAGYDSLRGGGGNDLLDGGSEDDELDGEAGDDTLIGGSGFDELSGGEGDDVYVFSTGDGNDEIDQWTDQPGLNNPGYDRIVFDGITRDHALLVRDGADLVVSLLDDNGVETGEGVTVWGHYYDEAQAGYGYGSMKISELVFDDQTVSDLSTPEQEYGVVGYGHGGDDSLTGSDDYDVLFGAGGNDTLDGGAGDDEFNGGQGDDTYVYRYGQDGDDTIFNDSDNAEADGADTLAIINAPSVPEDLTIVFSMLGEFDDHPDLYVQVGNDPSQGIVIDDFFDNLGNSNYAVSALGAEDVLVVYSDAGSTELLRLTGQEIFDHGPGPL